MDYLKISNLASKLGLEQKFALKIIDGAQLAGKHSLMHAPDENAIYDFTDADVDGSLLSKLIYALYSDDFQFILIDDFRAEPESFHTVKSIDLEKTLSNPWKGFIYFPADPSTKSLLAFIELIAHLRSPEGCPWDRKQTHATLRTNLLEETYEVLEAIDDKNMRLLEEELGDLLLQIVLQSQLATEEREFNIYEVIRGIHGKIVFRHPHVFSDWDAKDASTVIKNWEILKSQERQKKDKTSKRSLLDSVPKHLPALSLAQKYQERAARVGFDWPDIAPVVEKIEEEINELKEAPDAASRERELGDLLFAMVNLIRWYGLDAESVFREMNQRFLNRFSFIERTVVSQGKKMTDLTLAEMDEIWDQAKQAEAQAAQNEQ